MEHWLVFREATGAEKTYNLQNATTSIGRAPDNDVVFINEHSISRKHASIVRENGDFYLVDLGSKNGTKVNGQIVKRQWLATDDQKLAIIDCLFAVAAVDKSVRVAETNEIAHIAKQLRVDPAEVSRLRQKYRDHLESRRGLDSSG